MKKIIQLLAMILIFCISEITAFAETSDIKNVYMSHNGTLDANFTLDELIVAKELIIYQDDETGYKAYVIMEESKDYAHTLAFKFEDGDAFFGFKADIDYKNECAELVAVHSKAETLPHRILTDYEYSSVPYGEITYIDIGGYYTANIGYVTEIRELVQKGIKGQGVSLYVYDNGLIRIDSTVLDTDTKGGYDARSFKEVIGSNSRKIIFTFFVLLFVLKNFFLDNVSKNSAELLKQKKDKEQ